MAVEEQTEYHTYVGLGSEYQERVGQLLIIPNRQVTELGFWLGKGNNPTGDVTFTIRRASDDELILSKVLGDASEITTDPTYYEVTFDTPQTINEQVRILAEFPGGDYANYIHFWGAGGDVKEDEMETLYWEPDYYDEYLEDAAYRYTYTVGPPPTSQGYIIGDQMFYDFAKYKNGES